MKEPWIIENKISLSNADIESLVILYQPIFIYPSTALYLMLAQHGITHGYIYLKDIYQELHVTKDTFKLLLKDLEEVLLIRTFTQNNKYVIKVNKPLEPAAFLSHPVYGRLYTIMQGQDAYKNMKRKFVSAMDLSGFKEVSNIFNVNRLAVWDESNEEVYEKTTKDQIRFDVDAFYNTTSTFYVPTILRTQEMTQIIEEMGTLYNISFIDMRSFLYKCVNLETYQFDRKKFIQNIERHYGSQKVESVENPYELNPISYLKYLQKSDLMVQADVKLLESLSKEFGLNNAVINVLIEYVWNRNNYDLNKNYTQKIASVWKRRKVETLEDAIGQIKSMQEYTKTRGAATKIRINPTYDNSEQDYDDSLDDELMAMLKEE